MTATNMFSNFCDFRCRPELASGESIKLSLSSVTVGHFV